MMGLDPKVISISDVVVVKDEAVLSWDAGRNHGFMVLARDLDRWWDMGDKPPGRGCGKLPSQELIAAATLHNADVQRSEPGCTADRHEMKPDLGVHSSGAILHTERSGTAGYDMSVAYARNDAAPKTLFSQIYGRVPTPTEMLENPAPPHGWGGPNAVFFFDLTIDGAKPVTFERGTKIDIWFPFVLDDKLRYNVTFISDGKPTGPAYATVFDNVLHFELPSFSMTPGKELMAEVDGNW